MASLMDGRFGAEPVLLENTDLPPGAAAVDCNLWGFGLLASLTSKSCAFGSRPDISLQNRQCHNAKYRECRSLTFLTFPTGHEQTPSRSNASFHEH